METKTPVMHHLIGTTGHRDLSRAEEDRVSPILVAYFETHAAQYPLTPLRLLSGLAEGADRVVARTFLEVRDRLNRAGSRVTDRWELIAVLPFALDAFRDDFPESLEEFDDLIKQSSSVVVVSNHSVSAIRTDASLRVIGYEALGYHLLRHCSFLIALWDGIHLKLKGGTSHVVRLKLDGDENPNSAFAVHDCGPVFHIPVHRMRSKDDRKLGEAKILYPAAQLHGQSEARVKSEFDAAMAGINRFNGALQTVNLCDIAKSVSSLSPSSGKWAGVGDQWLAALSPLDRDPIEIFGAADMLASALDKKRRRLTKIIYCLGVLLTAALWTGLDGVAQIWMTGAYVTLLAAIFAVFKRLRQNDLSNDQLDYRFFAEALRIQNYWRLLDTSPEEDALIDGKKEAVLMRYLVLNALLSQQAMEIGWVREALRLCGVDPKPAKLVKSAKAQLLNFWVADQYAYFEKTERKYELVKGRIRITAIICAVVGIIAAGGVVATDQFELGMHLRHVAAISAALFPAVALLLESYSDRMAFEDQAKNMARMRAVFARFMHRIHKNSASEMPPALQMRALGEEALTECANWLVLKRSLPAVLPT